MTSGWGDKNHVGGVNKMVGVKMLSKCHDCGVSVGQLHERGCDTEVCPFCFGQLISCDCSYELLNLFDDDRELPEDVYQNGLTGVLSDRWEAMLAEKGRIPYEVNE